MLITVVLFEGRAYYDVKAYVSGDKLIIEETGIQATLTERSITEINEETSWKLLLKCDPLPYKITTSK